MALSEGLSLRWPAIEEAKTTADPADFVTLYARLLFRVAYSVLRSRAEAEDTVQDTFVRVLEHRNRLHAVRDPRVWIVRITWNLALDRRRRIRPDQLDELFLQTLISPAVPADQALASLDESRRALTEIDRLPKLERAALMLSALDELNTSEIAAILNRSESATRALLFRARTRLRERLTRKETRR